ncbi:MAG: transposase [Fibrobacteres bacterium]|nr:transposase [Fibrobacterota bacterium]
MSAHVEKKIFIHAFCLMPDHLHLCLEGAIEDEGFLRRWKSFTTHESWNLGWQGKLWQERSFSKTAFTTISEIRIVEYVLRNPEAAGLVSRWKDWPYWAEPRFGKKGWDT